MAKRRAGPVSQIPTSTVHTRARENRSERPNGAAGQALATNIGEPFGVEIGPDGALYVCEVRNHRVRRLDLKTGIPVPSFGRNGSVDLFESLDLDFPGDIIGRIGNSSPPVISNGVIMVGPALTPNTPSYKNVKGDVMAFDTLVRSSSLPAVGAGGRQPRGAPRRVAPRRAAPRRAAPRRAARTRVRPRR